MGIAAPFILKGRFASHVFKHCPFEGGTVAYAADTIPDCDPIIVVKDPTGQKDFAGDHPTRAHKALWDKSGYLKAKGGIPAPSETVPVVIIGGGVAGLSAAYSLSDLKPVLIEQAAQFGGNAKAERWEGTDYTIGAAYMGLPEEGTPLAQMMKDIGLEGKFKVETAAKDETVTLHGAVKGLFWQGTTDPANAAQFKSVYDKLIAFGANELPAIPPAPDADAEARKDLNELDSVSFADWFKENLPNLHPHIEEMFREYCWSAFAGEAEEVSAAQALNFICADLVSEAILPGGNAAIAHALFDYLKMKLPDGSLRSGSLVIDISHYKDATGEGVRVCYEGPDGALKTIQAKACVVTSAKFISKIVVSDLPADQLSAIESMEWRAYVVANVLLKNPSTSPAYDLYCLKNEIPHDAKKAIGERVFTDVAFASWAQPDPTGHSVVSLFRPYPYSGGREELYSPGAFEKLKADFTATIPDLLKTIGAETNPVVAVRMSRWGHALPLAAKGLIANGTFEKASRPFGRIFFGQQDSWGSPCFESAVASARAAADLARKAVGSA